MKFSQKVCLKIIFSLFLINCFFVYGETFRVAKLHELIINDDYTSAPQFSSIFDGVVITLPQDKTFITGIELNIKVPQIVASWRDTVAYIFYDNISPIPNANTIDYSGDKVSINTIPGQLNHTIYIPLNEKFNLKSTPYAKKIENIPLIENKKIFFRFILAMKGAPESLEYAQLEISAKPVLSNEGYFSLNVNQPSGKNNIYSVYIDDEKLSDKFSNLVLKEGEHHLSITSDSYRNEVRTFIVEKAKHTKLSVDLRGIEPIIKIISPENAKVSLDGRLLSDVKENLTVSQGLHTVKFTIGDYEIIKNVNAINGRTYTVNLTVDATVNEEE